jgi:hypothetical protein
MLQRLNLSWTAAELGAEHRCTARLLVAHERRSIETLAAELLHHRHLTADQVGEIL